MSASAEPGAGRAAFAAGRFGEAYRLLSAADAGSPLEPEDLGRFASAAYLVGDEATSVAALTRAHAGFVERGDPIRAASSAFWLGFMLAERPDQRAHAGGWFARAQRLVDEAGEPCVEAGWLRAAAAVQRISTGDISAAQTLFTEAAEVGRQFQSVDLIALARHGAGRSLLALNRPAEGFALLDEVMVSVTRGEIGPTIAGIVYCSVLSACQMAFDLRRAQEWTAAFHEWCAAHPDIVPYRGYCLVRRSELLLLAGAWPQAMDEACRACERLTRVAHAPEAGAAHYQRAELHRLRGEFDQAEDAYRLANHAGRRPQPGLALVRLAQGQSDAAVAAIRLALRETTDRVARVPLLRAGVEIMLAARDLAEAGAAASELDACAAGCDAVFLRAAAAGAAGAVALANGQAEAALEPLGRALAGWQELNAPYDAARARVSIGLAYRELGDRDGAALEFEAAHDVFERLGAAPDAARVEALGSAAAPAAAGGLTGREIEVLRLVATGATNRTIAHKLGISERTVARHLANIFTKLDLPSRAAATAYAYERRLV